MFEAQTGELHNELEKVSEKKRLIEDERKLFDKKIEDQSTVNNEREKEVTLLVKECEVHTFGYSCKVELGGSYTGVPNCTKIGTYMLKSVLSMDPVFFSSRGCFLKKNREFLSSFFWIL